MASHFTPVDHGRCASFNTNSAPHCSGPARRLEQGFDSLGIRFYMEQGGRSQWQVPQQFTHCLPHLYFCPVCSLAISLRHHPLYPVGSVSFLSPPYVIGQAIYIFILSFVMVALWYRADHYIFILWFLSSFFSSPNLSVRTLDVYHTSTHGVALVRI